VAASWIAIRRYARHLAAGFLVVLLQSCVSASKSATSGQQEEIHRLISTICETGWPDNFSGKADRTPSSERLIEIGLPSLQYGVLDLLLSDDPGTILLACRVLNDVVHIEHGWIPGRGWQDERMEQESYRLWKANGSLLWNSPKEVRIYAHGKWKAWVAEKMAEEK
jgi:hypothetical protein